MIRKKIVISSPFPCPISRNKDQKTTDAVKAKDNPVMNLYKRLSLSDHLGINVMGTIQDDCKASRAKPVTGSSTNRLNPMKTVKHRCTGQNSTGFLSTPLMFPVLI